MQLSLGRIEGFFFFKSHSWIWSTVWNMAERFFGQTKLVQTPQDGENADKTGPDIAGRRER
jgi:hypothetical protein